MSVLPEIHTESLLERGFTRRQVGRIASLLTAGAALPFYNEFAMAQEAQRRSLGAAGARRAMDSGRRTDQLQRKPARTLQGRVGSNREGVALWRTLPPFGEQNEFVEKRREHRGC